MLWGTKGGGGDQDRNNSERLLFNMRVWFVLSYVSRKNEMLGI